MGSITRLTAYNPQTRTVYWGVRNVSIGKTLYEFKVVVDKLPQGVTERDFGNHGTIVVGDTELPSIQVQDKIISRNAKIEKSKDW
ncbi:hypothetical protein MGH68_01970 [Erysipelothrix sp. D19-032]